MFSMHKAFPRTPAPDALPRSLVMLLAMGAGFGVASLYYAQPILSLLASAMQASDRAIASIPTVTQLGYALGILFLSPLGDKYDRRTIILSKAVMLTLALALCGLALWRVIDPLTRDEASAGREARGPGRARELEREKQAVLKAIKEIELDHQMRKIADVDYREMIERYRTRAMRLISEIEAGDNFRELIERELKDRLVAEPVARAAPPCMRLKSTLKHESQSHWFG